MPDTSCIEKISLEGCKVYGPYLRPDGRKHVIIYNSQTQRRKTVSYPKYILQYEQGLEYNKGDSTDHIDENFKNDDINNLQVLSLVDNVKKSLKARDVKAKTQIYICPCCKKSFEQFVRQVNNNQGKQKKLGPFCSRRCAGIQNQSMQRNFRKPRVAQLAEATDLSSVKFQFESEGGDQIEYKIENIPLT